MMLLIVSSISSVCGKTRLAVEDATEFLQFGNSLAVNFVYKGWVSVPFVCTNPANITHGIVIALDVKLVLQADRQTVERPNRLAIFL